MRWLDIPGYEGHYQVSDTGEARSLPRTLIMKNGIERSYPGKILSSNTGGFHRHVVLSGVPGRKPETWPIHQLVMLAFRGETPEGLEIRHLNDDKDDNRLENLAFGTSSDNMHDRVRNGIHHNSIKTHCKRGHPFDEENTFINHSGSRECRACRAAYMRGYQRNRRAQLKINKEEESKNA